MSYVTYPFTPSSTSTPQFTTTLDDNQYNVQIVWSLFGQRYYAQCFDLSGNQIFNVPLITSPEALSIETLDYNDLTLQAILTTTINHGYAIGQTQNLVVHGAAPDAYNGLFPMLSTGPNTLSYPLSGGDPGPASTTGFVGFVISLTGGYFETMMFYVDGQFVVGP